MLKKLAIMFFFILIVVYPRSLTATECTQEAINEARSNNDQTKLKDIENA